MNGFFKNPCNIYISLWSVYILQGVIYNEGSYIAKVAALIILVWSARDAILMISDKQSHPFLKSIYLILLMFIIYGSFLFVTDGRTSYAAVGNLSVPNSDYLKNHLLSLLPIFTFYKFSKNGMLSTIQLKKWILAFFVIAILQFQFQKLNQVQALERVGIYKYDVTNNAGYSILSLFPLLLLYDKNRIIQYLLLGVCCLVVIMGMKRGAILILIILLFLFARYKFKGAKLISKLPVLIVFSIIIFMLYRYMEQTIMNSDFFYSRMVATREGDSSGRDELYWTFWNAFTKDANIFQIFFGRGANGTLKISSNFAHNDWLEILTNQGLLGIVLFMRFWIRWFKSINFHSLYSSPTDMGLLLTFIMCIIRTMFSMSINAMSMYTTCFLGFCLAKGFDNDINEINNLNENINCR